MKVQCMLVPMQYFLRWIGGGGVWLPQVLPYSVTSTDNKRFTFDQLNDVKSYFFIVLVFVKSRSHIFMDGRSMVSVGWLVGVGPHN